MEAAVGGTLFLDEVNSLSLGVQAKLLRFLELGEVSRIGRQRPVSVDTRVVSAANVSLERLVACGLMRADFFYRINVLTIELPPLRERLDDLPLLVEQFLTHDPLAQHLGVTRAAEGFIADLRPCPWSGNVRELHNVLRRSVVLGAEDGVLRRVSDEVRRPAGGKSDPLRRVPFAFRPWIRQREREYLFDLFERYPTTAERVLASGIPERTLYRKMRSHGWRVADRAGAPVEPAEDGAPADVCAAIWPMAGRQPPGGHATIRAAP